MADGSVRPAALRAREISAGYGQVPAIRDVSLQVGAGEMVALLGANGAGKTTTLLALAGELPITTGSVEMDGIRQHDPLHRRARRGLALVTQERSVFMNLTCRENLLLGRGPVARAVEIIPELEPLMKRKAGLCSGGQQQMLTVARALAGGPRVLLADELSLGLAPLVVERIFDILRAAAADGVAVLIVEQRARQVLAKTDRAYVMRRGSVALQGPSADMLTNFSEIESAYLSSNPGTSDPELVTS